jgi:hypothetical protein
MQVELAQLSLEGMALELPPHQNDGVALPARTANIRQAEGLRGKLHTQDKGFQLRDVAATELVLGALDWHFGKKTFLATERAAKLGGVRAQIASGETQFDLDVELSSMQAERLRLTVGALKIAAEIDAVTLKLAVHDPDVGFLRAEQALFKDLELRTGDVVVTVPELRVRKLNVDWGGERFKLEASTLEGEQLSVTREGSVISANDVALAMFGMVGDEIKLGKARFGKLSLEASVPKPSSTGSTPSTKPSAPIFDYAMLDGLSGHLNVDVHVDIALPIIQHRRATHELRIPIDDGSIDYRKLESNLAPLEDSLIDFSVRDGGLVLELGLPLIRTRGRGKPILRWDLSPQDLELAEERRVRLAVLPSVRAANAASEPPRDREEDKESSVKLRSLSLENLEAVLNLAREPSRNAALRTLSFDSLQLSGGVHHDAEGEPREGTIRGCVQNVHASVEGVPVGSSALQGELSLGALRELAVRFVDLKPQKVRASLEALSLQDVALASRAANPPVAKAQPPVTSAIAKPS